MFREARQRVRFRPGARIGVIAASLAAAAALVLTTTAFASTTIGSARWNTDCPNFGSGADTVQASSAVGGPSYAVPPGGTSITSWSVQAGADTGPVGLEVWRPTTTPAMYQLIGFTGTKTLTAGQMNMFTDGTPITVRAGDLIGLRIEGPVDCLFQTSDSADTFGFAFTGAPTATETMSYVPFYELNIAATVEVASNPVPTTADQCKKDGWQTLTDSGGTSFKNQGDCVSFVATGGTNTAAGS